MRTEQEKVVGTCISLRLPCDNERYAFHYIRLYPCLHILSLVEASFHLQTIDTKKNQW